jgi:hypothetical protein
MDIKGVSKKILMGIFIITLLIPTVDTISATNDSPPLLSNPEFPDKVYVFLAPTDTLVFDDLYFEQYSTYFIWVEIVTPHNCTLTITLWDPDGKQFDLFEHDVFFEPKGSGYHEIPFGCAIEGNHTIEFTTTSTDNLNLYIKIEKWIKCLYDKILAEELPNMILYDVTRFYDGMTISPTIEFKTDYLYRFYFGRVSAISAAQSSFVSLNFSLIDPELILYTMFTNEELEPVTDVNRIYFGTAVGGEYTLNIEIESDVVYANIGYAVIQISKISDLVDPNRTDPTNTTNTPRDMFSISPGWTTGFILFFGAMITIVVVIVVKSKNKNIARFKERK